MMMDLSELSDDRLDALIDNHRRLGRTAEPLYLGALEERNRRKGAGLEFKKSLKLLWEAARQRRFLTYKDIADANGASWNKVRFAMIGHLFDLNQWAAHRGIPMLSAIVVDKIHLATGHKEPSGLKGFVEGARLLGFRLDDPESFHREQQQACFAWAADSTKPFIED
jgi:hypothetical protein